MRRKLIIFALLLTAHYFFAPCEHVFCADDDLTENLKAMNEGMNSLSAENQKMALSSFGMGGDQQKGGFSVAGLIPAFLFGSIGFVAFVYGKKMSSLKPVIIGLALMVYPYFVTNVWGEYAIGTALTAALFLFKD